MIQFNQSQRTLIRILGDGQCHSGNELGNALGITRSAIWKQINQLIDLGIPISRIPQQGYQLATPIRLLDETELSNHLKIKEFTHPFKLHLFTSIDSTNRFLKEIPTGTVLDICCAEIQTQGRGRFGRAWHSPFGENIYCSSRWNLSCDLSRLSGLSLVTSLAVMNSLKEFISTEEIKIKWPNDILWGNKKICGILIEIIAESNGNALVIIGIGLNVNTDTLKHPLPDKPWGSLYELSHQQFDRNAVIASLLYHLQNNINKFLNSDLDSFMDEWNQYDYLVGKHITVTQSLASFSGVACGIDKTGQLILEDDQGNKHLLSSGDTSLHSNCSINPGISSS
ncbi:biotin--[acetyl-CoA-carboxylase] ligase [Legionella quateirensis]|uniref:Bifunctional ligase/repressor BirA n=1 Tax=Legionella quateirensis TaxID=45072 RepID=A0A378KVL0_9GAMM|nr:biotin--[acetyl-CoA-carboxylase] ligase [Legionella quateirensis]KTD47633.1 biotin-[acetylCoA carboxylase] holoenzyme synthetase and biotin operon repressor [Legionella quateirensis]STY18612.1 biotin-[acetylCoA carboxylase] holoenzyme synthetase and biotin operon repressor [Legionella quateirensis]